MPDVTTTHNQHASPSSTVNSATEGLLRHQRRHQCLAILTGHPRVEDRLQYVVRLLRQLRQQVDVGIDDVNEATHDGDDECQNPTDVFVYCDGECGDTLRTEFSRLHWIEFRQLSDHHQQQTLSTSGRKVADGKPVM